MLVGSTNDLTPLKHRLKHVVDTIGQVRMLASHIGLWRPDVLAEQTLLALAILAETLGQVVRDVETIDAVAALMRDTQDYLGPWRLTSNSGRFDPARPVLGHMERSGWCPSDIARIKATVRYVDVVLYLAYLPPPRPYASHQRCTTEMCVAVKIDPTSYQLAHAVADCTCELVGVDSESISKVLRSGQLPLLETSRNPDEGPLFSVKSYISGEDFVALSHVWAAGLGNPYNNALHVCEMKRLFRLASSISTDNLEVPIWIDTLCVPIEPRDLHQLAMTKMRDPYRFASRVLVLDAYLLDVQAAEIDTSEIFARILRSTWMQRLWTLQEGRLGREVYFQFADRAVSLREQFSSTKFRRIPSQVYRSVQLSLKFRYEGSRFTDLISDYNGSIDNTRRAIKMRGVSVASDEALCVACLLNLELDDIVDAPAHERMAVLWRKTADIPVGLAFSQAKRKLDRPGLHWAQPPESFLGLTPLLTGEEDSWYGPNLWSQKHTATPSREGLIARLPGAYLHPNLFEVDERFGENTGFSVDNCVLLRSARGTWYMFACKEPWTDKARASDRRLRRALYLEQSISQDFDIQPPSDEVRGRAEFGTARNIAGVVATVQQVGESGILHVSAQHHVNLIRQQAGYQRCYETALVVARQMLADRRVPWWRDDGLIVQTCRAKAAEMFEENRELRTLYEDRRAHDQASNPAVIYFGELIVLFATLGDLLTIEALPDEQAWCID